MTEQKRLTLVEALESVLNETELATLRESEARLVELGHQLERYQKSPLKYLVENKGESGDDVRVALRPRKEAYDRLAQKLANGVCRATGYRILAQEIQSKTAETISVSAWKEGNLLDPSNGSILTFCRNNIESVSTRFDGVMIIPVYADWIESPQRLPLSQVWHWSQVLSFKVFNLLDPIEAGYWDIPIETTGGSYFDSKIAVKRAARDLVEAICSGELLRLNPYGTFPANGQINPQAFTYDTISDCVNYLEQKYFGLGVFGTYNKPAIEYFENIRFRRDDVLSLWQPDSSLEQPASPDLATPAPASIEAPPVEEKPPYQTPTTKGDSACRKWLEGLLQEHPKKRPPNQTKETLSEFARSTFGVSKRGFRDRVWGQLITPDHPWARPGPSKKENS